MEQSAADDEDREMFGFEISPWLVKVDAGHL
jgi:hypothetical protein